MAQYNLFLTEQERTKMKLIQINLNLKSANAVFQYLISEYKIKVTDEGFDKSKSDDSNKYDSLQVKLRF